MSADQSVDENSKMDSQPSDKEDTKPPSQGATPKAKQAVVSWYRMCSVVWRKPEGLCPKNIQQHDNTM